MDIQEKAQKPGKEETSGHNVQRLEYKPDSGGKLDRQGSFQRSRKKTAGQETEHSQKNVGSKTVSKETFGHDASHSVKHNHMESVDKPDKEIFQDNHSSFQNDTRKTAGQKVKPNQKKRRKQKSVPKGKQLYGK